ncbi:aminoglycoside phosphotransferase family protein [Ktedonosporobacter rubrisoli]|uniref:Aminoglycoside phosphotransferase family protein n=1 Tax=Ktedonosporobacter rubrisoli TaxID=2509675 RepID=A0A4P6K163_KTERU|nr:aminoglycoside phosphotransferase family protein [Ktedonosporobacter rubrisoli]QBD81573.1 aminoglycoside phosphotransferase family protein [Ktedonosporobacter rubrisoli]
MCSKMYSQQLGELSDGQFQAALEHFQLGKFVRAQAIPFGNFGQNVFVTSTKGEYVLRGNPHFAGQFSTEQFYTKLLHERTEVPVPWPYYIDPTTKIFGWSYVLMPRMEGLQLADDEVRKQLKPAEKRAIAKALGENLAQMQELTWPFAGRYYAASGKVEPFDLERELAWPVPVSSSRLLSFDHARAVSYADRVVARIIHKLKDAQAYSEHTTQSDITWAEEYIASAQKALLEPFKPCLVMEDYKEGNLVVTQHGADWRVSGVFDLMEAHFGDGEADLSRAAAMYYDEDPELARIFVRAYLSRRPPRPGFEERFSVYMLLDRAILWNFFQYSKMRWWDESWTFRDWASRYVSLEAMGLS